MAGAAEPDYPGAMTTEPSHRLPLFPLSRGVFPDGLLQLNIFEVRYLDLIRRCHRENAPFGVAWLAEGQEVQVPGQTPRLHPWGCQVLVRELETLQPALLRIRCQGTTRFALDAHEPGPLGVWQGLVRPLPADPLVPVPETLAHLSDELGALIAEAQRRGMTDRLPIYPPYRLDECGWLANRLAELLPLDADDAQALLAESDPLERLRRVGVLMGG